MASSSQTKIVTGYMAYGSAFPSTVVAALTPDSNEGAQVREQSGVSALTIPNPKPPYSYGLVVG